MAPVLLQHVDGGGGMIEERTGDKGPHRPSPNTALANTLSERLGMVHAACCVIWPSKQ